MTTNVLQDIIARCHQRHDKPLKQQKTTSTPPLYKGLPYHFTVYCAHRYPVMLQDLEAAGISFMPIGQTPGTDPPPALFWGRSVLETSTGNRLGSHPMAQVVGDFKCIQVCPRHTMAHHGMISTLNMKLSVPHRMPFLLAFKHLLMPLRTRY